MQNTAPEMPTASENSDVLSAIAHLYGEPMFDLPTDLYIPPEALEIFLEAFEGPLDLLLYLIRKQNLNVLDIPMAQLTVQYLQYVEQIRTHHLELAGEYLLMAATLIEIKSKILLPIKKTHLQEEAEDPRANLVKQLLEYEQFKLAAERIHQLPQQGRDFFISHTTFTPVRQTVLPDVHAEDLHRAFANILRRAKLVAHHTISKEKLSVREHMSLILRILQNRQFIEFSEIFDKQVSTARIIVHFIAILELARESLIDITQAAAYAPIYLRLSYTPNA